MENSFLPFCLLFCISTNPSKIGYSIIDNLLANGYTGKIFPVNPKGGEVLGLKIYSSIEDIECELDLVTVVIPAKFVYSAVESCSAKGTKFLSIITSGFSEIGNLEEEERIVKYAKENGIDVTLDAEEHDWTNLSLNAAKKLWDEGYNNLGIVLQSRLNRTEKDVADIKEIVSKYDEDFRKKLRVRACIGTYKEPPEIAATEDKEIKKRLVDRIKELFEAGVYVEIATHDFYRQDYEETDIGLYAGIKTGSGWKPGFFVSTLDAILGAIGGIAWAVGGGD